MDYDVPFLKENLSEKILTEEEFYYHFKKYKAGDLKARELIILHNIKLVYHVVNNKFFDLNYIYNDLISIGLTALIKSVDTFDISKKVKFSTYAAKCIKNEIIMFLRKEKKVYDCISLDFEFELENSGVSLKERLIDEKSDFVENVIIHDEEVKVIRELFDTLSEEDKMIIELRFGFNGYKRHKESEIAEIVDVSQSYISRRIKNILKELKNQFENNNENSKIKILK